MESPKARGTGRRIGRRALLVGGGGIAAVLGLSGGALLAPWPVAAGLRFLTATEAAAAQALAATLFHSAGDPTLAEAHFLPRFDESVGMLHPETGHLLKYGLRALEFATIPSFGARFSTLSLAQRVAAVRSWERCAYPWMAAMTSFRFQVAMVYFESDAARAACGWSLGCTPSGGFE